MDWYPLYFLNSGMSYIAFSPEIFCLSGSVLDKSYADSLIILYNNAQLGNAMAGQFFDGGMNGAFGQSNGKLNWLCILRSQNYCTVVKLELFRI